MSKTRKVLLILLGLALVKRPADVVLATLLPDPSVEALPQLIGGMVMTLLLMGLPAWLLRPWTSLRLTRTRNVWTDLVVGALAAVLVRMAMTPVDAAWQSILGVSSGGLTMPDNLTVTLLKIAALAIVPALAEEAFFRGALLTGLLDGSRRVTAVLLTTLTFALMHGNAAVLPSLLAASMLLTLLMLQSGRIAVPVTAHLVFNLTALIRFDIPLWGSVLAVVLLIALAACLIARLPRIVHQPMKWPDGLIAAAALAVLAALTFI